MENEMELELIDFRQSTEEQEYMHEARERYARLCSNMQNNSNSEICVNEMKHISKMLLNIPRG